MFKYFFKNLRFILLMILTSIFILLFTKPGLYVSLYIAQKSVPGNLTFKSVHGYLLGNFSIQQLRYSDTGIAVEAENLSLKWTPKELLNLLDRQFAIQLLEINKLKVMDQSIQKIQIDGNIGLMKNLPIQLNIDLQLDPTTSGKIQINGDAKNYALHVITINPFQLDLIGNIQNIFDTTPQFNVLASWKEISTDKNPKNNILTSGTMNISGDFNQYQGQLDSTLTMVDKKVYSLTADIQTAAEKLQANLLIKDKSLTLGSFTLQGQYDPKLNLKWTLAAPKLSDIFLHNDETKAFSGKLTAQGKITGLTTDTTFTAKIEGNELKYQAIYLKKILSNFSVKHIQTQKISADLAISLNSGDLIYLNSTDKGIEKNIIPIQKADTHIQWKNHILKADTNWIFDAAKRFKGLFIIQPLDWRKLDFKHLDKQHLSGELLFAINNLDFVNAPSSKIKKIHGTFQAKFKLAGTLAKPLWDGAAVLKAGGEIPDLGLILNQINLNLKSDPKNMHLTGEIISGKKSLLITGESTAKTFATFETFQAKITGNDFPLMNSKEYQINITPSLQIQWIPQKGKPAKLSIAGTVDIPSAKIQPLEFTQSLELPSDVVFVSDKQKETPDTFQLDSNINVRLGQDVQINTHGVTGRLEGSVLVMDQNNADTTGEGEIHIVDGTYNAYGQKLTVETGEADFNGGAIDNPQLLVRAVQTLNTSTSASPITNNAIPTTTTDMPTSMPITQFNKITVGVEITGNLDNPVVRLFSVPATLSQADILSFLILGRPMSQASSADGALLMRALSALNIDNGESGQITQQLQQTFGLDILNVETSSQYDPSQNAVTNSTSLVLGKKLSTNLFIDYSIGLMQGTNILRIKYILTPHWMLQTATDGTNEGVDVVYTRSN